MTASQSRPRNRTWRSAWVAALLLLLGGILLRDTWTPWNSPSERALSRPDLQAGTAVAEVGVPHEEIVTKPAGSATASASDSSTPAHSSSRDRLGEAIVRVVAPQGIPLVGADVWLADAWYAPRDLRRSNRFPHAKTDSGGVAVIRASPGKYYVHVAHPKYVGSRNTRYGNGDRAILQLEEHAEATLRMFDVYVLAYDFANEGTVAVQAEQGTGYEVLHRDWNPLTSGALREIEDGIRLNWPGAKVMAFLHDGREGALGDWHVNVCWAGRTPTKVKVEPIALTAFQAPATIGFGDSLPSSEFGTVVLSGLSGFKVEVRRIGAEPWGRSFLSHPGLSIELRLGEPATLPSGQYELGCSEHPFLAKDLQRGGPIHVSAGSYEDREITLARVLRRVSIDMRLPQDYSPKAFLTELVSVDAGTRATAVGHNEGDNAQWWLPVGNYGVRIMMATESEAGLALQAEVYFRVEPGDGPQVVAADLLPVVVSPPAPLQFVAPSGSMDAVSPSKR